MLTSLIFHCAAWIGQAVALGGLWLGRQPAGRPLRWVLAGGLFMTTGAVLDSFGHYRRWPASLLAVTGMVQIVTSIACIACAVIVIALRIRSQRSGQMRDIQRTPLRDLLRADESSRG